MMRRIGILTAGGDTPALNATIHGAVVRANHRKVEVVGLVKGFSSLFNPRIPHVVLNPLFAAIPELDPTRGGTLLGASRDYLDPEDREAVRDIVDRLYRLRIDGLICVGGDGTLNGMQPLAEHVPTVLAPKTIDNDLGLNYRGEADEWERVPVPQPPGYRYTHRTSRTGFDPDAIVNYVTPGYATAVFVSAMGVQRIRTTAESHRRIAIVEVMGRYSGYIALGAAYGQPDIVLVPEHRLDVERLVEQVTNIYDMQKNVVIVCAEGVVDGEGRVLGAESASTDPAGNVLLSGAAEALRQILVHRLGDEYFVSRRRNESARAAIFTRKVGHTQRGGRPVLFDRFHAVQLGGQAVDLLLEGRYNSIAVLQRDSERGFHVDGLDANELRDRWGLIHARQMHPSLYDPVEMRPSLQGVQYLSPIMSDAVGTDDMEAIRQTLFNPDNLVRPYRSINTDVAKRIRYLEPTVTSVPVHASRRTA